MPREQATLVLLLCAVLLVSAATQASVGVSGKISGEVFDSQTGEPIIGATVQVLGTSLGTITDDDGEYFIISIPVGKYNIAVSSVGFEAVTKKEVRVLVDLTTPVDFEVKQRAVELGEEVIVYASAPIIQRDLTESKVIFTADRLRTLPNINTVQSVLTNYPGVVVDENDEFHVRGGRDGQVGYYYDGYVVQDPFYATSGIRIMPTALEELSLTSGGYTAEYGDALSGVVSAVTREGGPTYEGSVRAWEGATRPYDVTDGQWGKLSRVGNRAISFNLSGPIPSANPKTHTFFAAGEYMTTESFLPHNDYNTYSGTAKIAIQPTPHITVKADLAVQDASGEVYYHRDANGVSYDFNLDGLPAFERKAYLVGLKSNYNFNERYILSANVSRFRTYTKVAPEHLMDVYWDQWPGYSEAEDGSYNGTIHEDNYRGNGVYDATNPYHVTGYTTGDDFDPSFNRRESIHNAAGLHLVAQVNKSHQFKGGVDIRRNEVDWDFKQFFNQNPYGEKYTSKPLIASAFLQDKMEYANFVVNVGLRLDYRDNDISYNVTPLSAVATFKEADATWRLSPRLGVSFPISERSVMHFNYGTYYQTPQYQYLYTNLQGDVTSGRPLLGNPDLDPEQTVAYEVGLNHLIEDDLRLDVTAYYKDISELVTTRITDQTPGTDVTGFDNGDYGSVKGFDVSLEKLAAGGLFSGSISYGYMIAQGNGSSALEPYYTYLSSAVDTLAPVGEYPLDFDQRHTLTAVLGISAPRDYKGNLFGLAIPGAWAMSMVAHYGSGLPYTPTDAFGNRLNERNEGRLPANYTVDARFAKDVFLTRGEKQLTLFVEVDNLFDRRNVLNVYSRTGRPDTDGAITGAGLALSQSELDELDALYDYDPENYSSPRTVRLGLELNF